MKMVELLFLEVYSFALNIFSLLMAQVLTTSATTPPAHTVRLQLFNANNNMIFLFY